MNPSRYELPQRVSPDRRRARTETLRLERERFTFKRDAPLPGIPGNFRWLPPSCEKLPSEYDFPPSKIFGELAAWRLWTAVNLLPGMAKWVTLFRSPERYAGVFQGLNRPAKIMSRWRDDAEFGRQRLTGVNPMQIRCLQESAEGTPLWEAAEEVLKRTEPRRPIKDMYDKRRLFYTDYSSLWHPRVQSHVHKGISLAAPTCLFWTNDTGHLMPLAIQLKPRGEPKNPVFTPLSPEYDWMMARAHAQAADTHTHEGTYHLLETHLVSGAVALCMYRQLHPDHPVRQILEPHYADTLAINKLALGGLLAEGGTIDTAIAAGVSGTLDAARMHYAGWSFTGRSLAADLKERGVDDSETLPFYYYRDDASNVRAAIRNYVKGVIGLWYGSGEDVVEDTELQAWVAETASSRGGDIPGFPASLSTVTELCEVVTELIFRAGPQHAAVNNGQFEAYAWVPNSPAMVRSRLPEEPSPMDGHFTSLDFWRAMPSWSPATSQLNMVWVLSKPTTRTLLHVGGESPALSPSYCPQVDEIVGGFRRRLHSISQKIQRRNATLDIPYVFLDPLNISRSTDI
jgi:hypothetical protein